MTTIQAFCTLRTPFDIAFNALLNHGSQPKRPWQTHMFYKYAHNSGPKGPPDMILIEFYLKCVCSKRWDTCRGLKPTTTNYKKSTQIQKCNPKWVPQNPRPPARPCGGSGRRQPPGKWLKLFRHQNELRTILGRCETWTSRPVHPLKVWLHPRVKAW